MLSNYWDERYSKGGISGKGSIGKNRNWKWKIIEKYVSKIDDVIDIGCGDLSFWKDRKCSQYIGIDISRIIIEKNKKKRTEWKFICCTSGNYISNISAEIVFCFDIIFHILDERELISLLFNLCHYSKKWIFFYTWKYNPFLFKGTTTDTIYQKYWEIVDYFWIFDKSQFQLVNIEERKKKNGALFIFHSQKAIR